MDIKGKLFSFGIGLLSGCIVCHFKSTSNITLTDTLIVGSTICLDMFGRSYTDSNPSDVVYQAPGYLLGTLIMSYRHYKSRCVPVENMLDFFDDNHYDQNELTNHNDNENALTNQYESNDQNKLERSIPKTIYDHRYEIYAFILMGGMAYTTYANTQLLAKITNLQAGQRKLHECTLVILRTCSSHWNGYSHTRDIMDYDSVIKMIPIVMNKNFMNN